MSSDVPQIPGPVFLPTDEPPADEPAVVHLKTRNAHQPPPKPVAWRVTEADLVSGVLDFMVAGLKQQWPHAIEDGIVFWSRMAINNANICLIRSEHCVGAAEVTRTFLEPAGTVRDLFYIWPSDLDPSDRRKERIGVYYLMKHWAKAIGAHEFHFSHNGGDTSFTIDRMKARRTYQTHVVPFTVFPYTSVKAQYRPDRD